MRVYLPTTMPGLAGILAKDEVGPSPLQAFAVTPALREAYASGDDEELEYVAMLAAATQSLRLLHADPGAPRRRVVLAADVPDAQVSWHAYDDEPAAVQVGAEVPLKAIAAGHVDALEAVTDVAAAADAITAADAGDDDASFAVDSAEAHELAWYATQELQYLEEELGAPVRGERSRIWMLSRGYPLRSMSQSGSIRLAARTGKHSKPRSRSSPGSGPNSA